MHHKLNHRVGATRTAQMSLPSLPAREWNSVPVVSTYLKPQMAESRTNNNEVLGNPGNGSGLKSCLTPFLFPQDATRAARLGLSPRPHTRAK